MLRIGLHWAQYTSGISRPIMEYPMFQLPYLESKWLQSLREYLNAVNGRIRLDNPGIPQLQREYDMFLMDIVFNDPTLKPIRRKRINWCRLYLNVTLVSGGWSVNNCVAAGPNCGPACTQRFSGRHAKRQRFANTNRHPARLRSHFGQRAETAHSNPNTVATRHPASANQHARYTYTAARKPNTRR